MRNRLFAFICFGLFFSLTQTGYAQSCLVNAGNDTTITCGGCATLNATFVPINTPTNYTLSTIPWVPYSFSTGTGVILGDDSWSGVINMPFPFCFYGTTYNQCIIGSNGAVSFDVAYANMYCTWPINVGNPWPNATPNDHRRTVAAPWQDLNPQNGASGNIRYTTYGTAPCRVFVVSWNAVGMFSCTSNLCTQQIVLYESTNVIETYIQTRLNCGWNGGRAVHAIQNQAGTSAVVVPNRNANNPAWTTNNDARRWTPNGPPTGTITWFQGATQIGTGTSIQVCPTTPTVYTAQVSYTGCSGPPFTSSDNVTVNASGPGFTLSFSNVQDALCNGDANGQATVDPSVAGTYTYSWNTTPVQSTQTANNLPAGTYTVTVTDQLGCDVVGNVTINEPPVLTAVASSNPALCNGANTGSATVVAGGGVGGYLYNWNTNPVQNTATASNINAGNYTVTVTDANGCQATANVTVNQPSALSVNLNPTLVSCFGSSDGTITANPNGGTFPYTYTWNTNPVQNGSVANNLAAGNYSVTVTDANGCTFIGTSTVGSPALLQASLNVTANSCAQLSNGSIQCVPSGGTSPYSYSWSNGQNTQTAVNLGGGTFTVTVTDANGCTTTATGTVTPPQPMTLTTTGPNEMCNGETATITGSASGGTSPYTYSWTGWPGSFSATGPSITVSPSLGTNYYFTATDANGCQATLYHGLDVHPLPIPLWHADPKQGCDELTLTFQNISEGGVTFLWSFGDGSTSTDVSPTHTFTNGVYDITLTATSSEGCTDTRTEFGQIVVIPGPTAAFTILENPTGPIVVSEGTFHFINQSSNAISYLWEFGDGATDWRENPTHTYTWADTFIVTLTASNEFGCTDQMSFQLEIVPDGELFIPNAFTPNGDNVNELFDIGGSSITNFNIEIYDRWGNQVFASTAVENSWDGTVRNQPAPEGVYTFKILATFLGGHTYEKGGTVTLLR